MAEKRETQSWLTPDGQVRLVRDWSMPLGWRLPDELEDELALERDAATWHPGDPER